MTVINSQTDEDAVYCCKEIVNYISVFLRFKVVSVLVKLNYNN